MWVCTVASFTPRPLCILPSHTVQLLLTYTYLYSTARYTTCWTAFLAQEQPIIGECSWHLSFGGTLKLSSQALWWWQAHPSSDWAYGLKVGNGKGNGNENQACGWNCVSAKYKPLQPTRPSPSTWEEGVPWRYRSRDPPGLTGTTRCMGTRCFDFLTLVLQAYTV